MVDSSEPVFTKPRRWGFEATQIALMDRYILAELLVPFLLGVGLFSVIGLALGTLFDLIHKVTDSGLAIATALQIFGLQIPRFVVLALPMSTLLTTLTIYSRFSSSLEVMALQGCGVSFRRLVLPAIGFSLLVMGLTFTFNETLVPQANYQAARLMHQALRQEQPTYQDKNVFYREFTGDRIARIFYARRFDGQVMRDLTVLNFTQGELHQIIAAESGSWSSVQNQWHFFRGTIYNLTGSNSYQNITKFERQTVPLSRAPLDLAVEDRKSDQMGIRQAEAFLRLVEASGDEKRMRKLRIRIQEKYALPSICVVFGLIGAVLGLRPHRRASSWGFGLSLLIIFGYYLFSFITSSLAEGGLLPAVIAAWLPTVVGLLLGGGLLAWLDR